MALYLGLGFAIVATVLAVTAFAMRNRPVPCPRCRSVLEIDVDGRTLQRIPGVEMCRTVEAYRCPTCGGEFRQLDRGPLVSLETWNAGVDFPQARVHRHTRDGRSHGRT